MRDRMPVIFKDAFQNEGLIDEDFSVKYSGPEEVDSYIEEIVAVAPTDEQAIEDLIATLPDEFNITEVKFVE